MLSNLRQFLLNFTPKSWRLSYRHYKLKQQHAARQRQILDEVFKREIPSLYPKIADVAGQETLRSIMNLTESFSPSLSTRQLHSVSWPSLRHPVSLRENTSDVAIFCQVIVLEQYKPILPNIVKHDPFLIDCGANIGLSSVWLLSQFPRAKIVAIEPEKENHKLCSHNLSAYIGQYEAIQAAVWSKSGETLFLTNPDESAWGFQFGSDTPDEKKSNTFAVPTIGVSDIIAKSPTGKCDLLKIDIEGAEKELFQHYADEWLNSTLNLAIEIHGEACHNIVSAAAENFFSNRWHDGEVTFYTQNHRIPSHTTV